MSKLLLRSFILTSLCTSLLFTPLAQAQSVKAEQTKLVQLQTEQTTLSEQIKQLEAEIAATQTALAAAQSKPSPGKEELELADKALADAKAGYAANPNDTNQTILNNAEFKRHLVERKLLKAGGGSTAELQSQLKNSEAQLATLKTSFTSNITAQKNLIADAEKKAAAKAELEKTKAAEIAKAKANEPTAEQKAEKAAKKEAEIKQREVDAAAAQAKVAAEQKAKADQQAAATALAAKKSADEAAADSNGLIRLNDNAAVDKELARMTALAETFWSKSKVNQILYIRNEGSDSKKSSKLRDLGHLQYRTELIAQSGKLLLNIGFQKWELTFNSADVGQTFVFIYDQSNAQKPRLVYYAKSFE